MQLTRNLLLTALLVLLLAGTLLACREDGEETPTASANPAETPVAGETTATPEPDGEPTAEPAGPDGVVINEILPGVPGNNNQEFVELYNGAEAAADLAGWSLWYRLAENQEAELVYRWDGRADIPATGYYLLARAGEMVGAAADAAFSQPLAVKGMLQLKDETGTLVDQLAWGNVSAGLAGGSEPAPAPADGASLARQARGIFDLQATPDAQNSGSQPVAGAEPPLSLRAPEGDVVTVTPGETFTYPIYIIENGGDETLANVQISVPVPAGFTVVEAPPGSETGEGRLTVNVAEVPAGGREFPLIRLQAPWTYTEAIASGLYAELAGERVYARPFTLAVSGGAIPIARARELVDEVVTIEGVATMYTGGFFAGNTGTKFYLEDESGGIQVYVPGGMGVVEVEIGETVRVTGKIEVYRNSLEIIPVSIPDDVVTVEGATEPVAEVEPAAVTVEEANEEEEILGRLVVAEGTVTRVEEFSYSYEVDLTDESGNTLLVYVEKDTGVSVEPLAPGEPYRITGISELYNDQWQLKPRQQRDFTRVVPPELRLALDAPNTVAVGTTMTYTITATNYTGDPLHNLAIRATLPAEAAPATVADGGTRENGTLLWEIGELEAHGGQAVVRFSVTAEGPEGSQIVVPPAVATADEWPQAVRTEALLTFIGETVPIWAIQGEGETSPYARREATTAGVVTGIFPELGGFWIQERRTDENPLTPAGLFVLTETEPLTVSLATGDLVQVEGTVRERSGQTLLEPLSAGAVLVTSEKNPLPEAVELDPPAELSAAQRYYESLEGMLVRVSGQAVAVGPTNSYGEYALVRADLGIERVYRGDPAGMLIFVDDGSEIAYEGGDRLPYAVNGGDLVANVTGPLAYTFGQYKIEPVATPVVTRQDRVIPALPVVDGDRFSIATYNVENFFDLLEPHPSSPAPPTAAEYRAKVARTAAVIEAMGAPTVLALQEVENVGILEDLAEEAVLAGYDYRPVLIEGYDSRGIDVGYLVRGDQATVAGAAAYDAPEGLTSRPPLLLTVTLKLESGNRNLYVINNHFTSMAAGEEATEPRRMAQAAWAAAVMEAKILAEDPEAWVAITGDLNSFLESRPLDTLRSAGLHHVYELIAPEREYSYIYQGESETLDHILVTRTLYERLNEVSVLHINADYAAALGAEEGEQTARVSDHDPVVATFTGE